MSETQKLAELIVTKDGVPFEDQADGIRQFKAACLRAAESVPKGPPPTDGLWCSIEALQAICAKTTEEARAQAIEECAAELHRQAEFRHGAHKRTVLSLAENLRALNGSAK